MKATKSILGTLTITMALLAQAQAQAQTFPTNGLVAYYPFNGNANDASGNGHNGTNQGAVLVTDRFGIANAAYRFDGTSSFIDLSMNPPITGLQTTFSISGWMNAASLSAVRGLYYHRGNYADIGVRIDKMTPASIPTFNFVTLASSYGGQDNYFYSSTQMPTNVWLSFAVTYDGATKNLYINGRLDTSVAYSTALNWNFNFAGEAIGGGFAQQAESFDGIIDDVRIYKRALSASEVQQLYDYESGPRLNLIKAVKPSFSNLTLTTNYQLQVSGDLSTWTNQGSAFTATNTSMIYPQYWDVDNWGRLFFRLQISP
jgi:hypothetical protein